MLTDEEHAEFSELNQSYTKKFGFPFVVAVKGLNKEQILTSFKKRLKNDQNAEVLTACREVMRIAEFRLKNLLP